MTTTIGTILFILASVGSAAAVVWGRFRKVPMKRVAAWPVGMPIVVDCDSDISSDELEGAVDHWAKLGWPIYVARDFAARANVSILVDPTIDTRDSIDDDDMVHGVTKLDMAGYYKPHPTGLPIIHHATVRVLPGADALLLAHELGHALGIDHVQSAPAGYLMGAVFDRVGWDSRGLEYPGQ